MNNGNAPSRRARYLSRPQLAAVMEWLRRHRREILEDKTPKLEIAHRLYEEIDILDFKPSYFSVRELLSSMDMRYKSRNSEQRKYKFRNRRDVAPTSHDNPVELKEWVREMADIRFMLQRICKELGIDISK